jgi:hypothetical protein
MLQVYVDDFVPNCALNVFYEEGEHNSLERVSRVGLLKKVLNGSSVGLKYQMFFNTSTYSFFLPPLYNKYPNMAMQFMISAAKPPSVEFNTTISGYGSKIREEAEGWKDGRMEGWKDGRMEGWKDGRMEGWKDGRTEGQVEGWRDEWRFSKSSTQIDYAHLM